MEQYFADAVPAMRALRSSRALPAIDKLRLELDEVWQHGAMLARDSERRPFRAGAGRVMRPNGRWGSGFIHVDELAVMTPRKGLFAASVYLRMPPTGGELDIYNVHVGSRWEFYRNAATLSCLLQQDAGAQARLRRRLPAPLRIAPAVGDLVIMCVQRPHAVRGFSAGTRVSAQTFITFGEGEPLLLDT